MSTNKQMLLKSMYQKGLISKEKYLLKARELGLEEDKPVPVQTSIKVDKPVSKSDAALNAEEQAIMAKMPEHMRNNVSDGNAKIDIVTRPSQYGGIDFSTPNVDVAAVEARYAEHRKEIDKQKREQNKTLQAALAATSKLNVRAEQSGDSKQDNLSILRSKGFRV